MKTILELIVESLQKIDEALEKHDMNAALKYTHESLIFFRDKLQPPSTNNE